MSTPISKAYVFMRLNGVDTPIGVIEQKGGQFIFGYGKSWQANPEAFSIDPLNLPLSTEIYRSEKLWPCFDDATPEKWGRRVIQAVHRTPPRNEIEWLLISRGAGVGALRFSGALNKVLDDIAPPRFEDLVDLIGMADSIAKGEVDPDTIDPRLAKTIQYGSSMGGARPKVTVSDGANAYIAKLTRHDDLFDQVRAEAAFLQMAKAAGLRVEEFQLHEVEDKTVLAVKRFDRSNRGSVHYLSAYALVNPQRVRISDPESVISYRNLAHIVRKVSASPADDLRELFGRMCFNVLIGNTDDHLRNHGFLHAHGEQYRLSPVFDVLPHPEQTAEHALQVGKHGRVSSIENLLSGVSDYGLSLRQAKDILRHQAAVVADHQRFFDEIGLKTQDQAILRRICTRLLSDVERYLNQERIFGSEFDMR